MRTASSGIDVQLARELTSLGLGRHSKTKASVETNTTCELLYANTVPSLLSSS